MKPDWKKLFLACFPYLLIAWLFNKVGQCYRLVPGADAVVKVMAVIANLGAVIRHTPLPSLHRHDLFVGVIGAALLFVVYFFNLDMKLTAKMEPLLTWVYDNKVKRDQHL